MAPASLESPQAALLSSTCSGNRFIANPCGHPEGEAAPAPIAVSRGCCGVRGGVGWGGTVRLPDPLRIIFLNSEVQKEKVLTERSVSGSEKVKLLRIETGFVFSH